MKLMTLIALLPMTALAGNAPKSPVSNVDNRSSASAHAGAAASSRSTSTQYQSAHGGSAEQGQVAEGGDAAASNEGNTLAVETSYKDVRQVPMAFSPGVFPTVQCGHGWSIGVSTPVGAISGGKTKTDPECVDFARHVTLSQSFAALGMIRESCQVLMHTPLASDVWSALPSCEVQPVAAETAPDVATKQDLADTESRLAERMDRQAVKAAGK